MPARIFVDQPLHPGAVIALPAAASRHVQVLRLQPGATLTLFNGHGGEHSASVVLMARSEVQVRVGAHDAVERETRRQVTLAIGMPANERMDTVIEKATELGAAAIVPLLCERTVLRLSGERAEKRLAHWRGVAVAACEQSGRTRLPAIAPVEGLAAWLQSLPDADAARWMLSLGEAPALSQAAALEAPRERPLCLLSGPEGGLTADEEALARRHGFTPLSLGPRVLRADTAPLAALACLGALFDG